MYRVQHTACVLLRVDRGQDRGSISEPYDPHPNASGTWYGIDWGWGRDYSPSEIYSKPCP